DELRRLHAELAPGDFLVGDGAGIAAVAGGGVADLAEVAPQGDVLALQILVQHGHDANGEVAGDAAADLKHAERAPAGAFGVEVGQPDHVFDAGADRVDVADVAADDCGGVHVSEG